MTFPLQKMNSVHLCFTFIRFFCFCCFCAIYVFILDQKMCMEQQKVQFLTAPLRPIPWFACAELMMANTPEVTICSVK